MESATGSGNHGDVPKTLILFFSHPLPLLWIEKGARIWSASPEEVGRETRFLLSFSGSRLQES